MRWLLTSSLSKISFLKIKNNNKFQVGVQLIRVRKAHRCSKILFRWRRIYANHQWYMMALEMLTQNQEKGINLKEPGVQRRPIWAIWNHWSSKERSLQRGFWIRIELAGMPTWGLKSNRSKDLILKTKASKAGLLSMTIAVADQVQSKYPIVHL